MDDKPRCPWCLQDEIYMQYHDQEWGVPVHDDTKLFEMINLEGAQAGLSWYTVLIKRENYREAFDHWDAEKIARYDEAKVTELRQNAGIIRNRLKIQATIGNAQAFLNIQEEMGSFNQYLWEFVDHQPIINHWTDMEQVPVTTEISDKLSKALKKRGFKFVGSTICYAFMQAIGMVDDHLAHCWKRNQ